MKQKKIAFQILDNHAKSQSVKLKAGIKPITKTRDLAILLGSVTTPPKNPHRAILLGPIIHPTVLRKILQQIHLNKNDYLIGIDDGARLWTKVEKKPDLAIGDWDSLKENKILKDISHYTLPREKNRSDLYFALLAARTIKAKSVICLGVTGGRMDHHQATLLELSHATTMGFKSVSAIDSDSRYYFLSNEIPSWNSKMKSQKAKGTPPEKLIPGQTLSIFAMSQGVQGLTLKGLKYPFTGKNFLPSSRGLSNLITNANCRVSITSGKLLILIPN